MNFDLTEEQKAFREAVSEFCPRSAEGIFGRQFSQRPAKISRA